MTSKKMKLEDDLNFKAVLLSWFNNKNLKKKWFCHHRDWPSSLWLLSIWDLEFGPLIASKYSFYSSELQNVESKAKLYKKRGQISLLKY